MESNGSGRVVRGNDLEEDENVEGRDFRQMQEMEQERELERDRAAQDEEEQRQDISRLFPPREAFDEHREVFAGCFPVLVELRFVATNDRLRVPFLMMVGNTIWDVANCGEKSFYQWKVLSTLTQG